MDFRIRAGEGVGIFCDASESEAVQIAVHHLREDLKKVADIRAEESGSMKIWVGTLGTAGWTEAYRRAGKLCDDRGNPRREAYLLKVQDGTLMIVGTDRRGTIYGVYEFCERIGVSPWYDWADVPVKKSEEIFLPWDFEASDYPSVEYRGIFINDEEELDHWAQAHMGESTIGLHTYEKIFELILRLKGNYIWPAMHVNSFNMHVENGALADRMGVVVGTSHCDMLMRSNNREWIPWITKKGYTDAEYDYSIEGRNREILKEYWKESVEQNAAFEVSYTLGMRGIHDSGFETKHLHAETEEEMREKKIQLLQTVMDDQQQILKDTLDQEPLKLFVPYKEVLELYDNGLKIPEDITLIWSNDNYGYVRRYPSEKEQARRGGHGIYYHNSYWAPPGRSYLFICSIPLAQTKYELEKAYENGIRKLWVMNVGAMKPLEQEIEFYLRLAWEIGKEGEQSTDDVDAYLEQWINKNFTGGHGKEMAGILNDFTQIVNVRKIENMEEDVFSLTAYGDEWTGRMNRIRELYDRANAVYALLPEEERDAFFQLALMKIHAAYYTNAMYYFADRSALCAKQGKPQAAWGYAKDSRFFEDLRRKMLTYYNKEMAGGKWDRMVTPEDFPPPRTAMYPASTPPLSMGRRSMHVTCWNGKADRISFGRPGTKWLEIANGGEGRFAFAMEADPWITLSVTHGEVETEVRVMVTVRADAFDAVEAGGRRGRIVIKNLSDQERVSVAVTAEASGNRYALAGRSGEEERILESRMEVPGPEDGALAFSASDGVQERGEAGWRAVKRLGRGGGDLMESRTPGGRLSYAFFLDRGTDVLLEVHRYPSLNSIGPIRVGVSVDGADPLTLSSQSNDEWRGNWAVNTMDHVDKLCLLLPRLGEGSHTISFVAMEPYFAFSRFVLYTGERKENNLGIQPGEQRLLGEAAVCEAGSIWYGAIPLEPRPAIYADADFDKNSLTERDAVEKESQKAADEPETFPVFRERVERMLDRGRAVHRETRGAIAIDAAEALAQSPFACTEHGSWQYCFSESYNRGGLALYIREKGLTWTKGERAPSLQYRMDCSGGTYCVWALTKFNSRENAAFSLAVDGQEIAAPSLYGGGNLWRYEAEQAWRWIPMTKTTLKEGVHTLTLTLYASGIRIDRIYMTKQGDLPPLDGEWEAHL